MFKGIAGLASLMRNAGEITGKMEEMSRVLMGKTVVGSAGGDMVVVHVNGLSQVVKVTIDPLLMAKGDKEMLEMLLPSAINQALTKAKQLHLEAMKDLTGGLELPDMGKMLERFSAENDSDATQPRG